MSPNKSCFVLRWWIESESGVFYSLHKQNHGTRLSLLRIQHNTNNSMDTAVTGSTTNSMHCLNTISAPASASALASAVTVGVPTAVGLITPATVVNNNNNNTNASHLIEEIASENFWLREKVKEINADRDRLLCEVANLRLELDMAELKRLPEDRWVSFFHCFKFNFPSFVRKIDWGFFSISYIFFP